MFYPCENRVLQYGKVARKQRDQQGDGKAFLATADSKQKKNQESCFVIPDLRTDF